MTRPALVAPDSFKGSFSAFDVAAALARGLRAAGREAEELPVADGGEGTMDVLLAALGGERRTAGVHDPLGRSIEASFALLRDGSAAIVEAAQASGLGRVAESERDAFAASSYGTGELIAAAVEAGAERVLVAVGGSATTDGGAGALEALREAGVAPADPGPLRRADALGGGAAGVRPAEGRRSGDGRAARAAPRAELAAEAPRDPRGVPMTGAAGGLAGGLWAWLGAELVPGAPYVLDAVGFDARMREAAFVVTGEGKLDEQTLAGKICGEVATRCRQRGVACHAVVGRNELEPFQERILDLASVTEATTLAELEAAGRALVEPG